MKVEIDFPAIFESADPLPIPIGRLLIGGIVCRISFAPDGKLHLWAPDSAKNYFHFYSGPRDDIVTFGIPPAK